VALALTLILIRPWRISEAIWACSGAALLVVSRIVSPDEALAAAGRGTINFKSIFAADHIRKTS
jgi:Na+/H+ antiporter NhaD/arsenite permease-like protein